MNTRSSRAKKMFGLEEARRLAAKIKASKKRIAALAGALPEDATTDGTLAKVVEELQSAVEELAVVHEKLCAQNEELVKFRAAVDFQRSKYSELFQSAPDGYVVTDLCGVVTEANRAFANMVDMPIERIVGKPLETFIAEKWRDHLRQRIEDLSSPSTKAEWHVKIQSRLKPNFTAAIRMNLIWNQQEHLSGIRWLFRESPSPN